MITRKLGGLLRGNATPFQLMAASILGTLLGFAPGPAQAPALYAILLALLLVANANLGLALLCAGLGRLVAMMSGSLAYSIGAVLLDGPTSGLAHALVNAPVLAWCGFEYYAVTGGQALGLMLGTLIGLGFTRTVRSIRMRMLAAQDNPSRLRELAARPWARFLLWLFVGGVGKKTWAEKLAVRVGNPIRIWGAALLLLLLVGLYLGQQTLAGPLASNAFQSGLQASSGASVDLGALELEVGEGRLALFDLAMADAAALDTDIFRASHLEADIGQADFLRKRLHITRLVVKGAGSGLPRATAGKRTSAQPVEEPAEEAPGSDLGEFRMEELLKDYATWKQRLTQVRHWLDKLGGSQQDAQASPQKSAKKRAMTGEWLSMQAEHLIDEAPTLRLSELVVEDFEAAHMPGRKLNIKATELSTHPGLLEQPPRFELRSQDGLLDFFVDLAPVSLGGGDGALRFSMKALQLDEVMAELQLPGTNPFRGGTLEIQIDGSWDQGRIGWIDLPLVVTMHNTSFALDGGKATPLELLALRIGLKGPIDAPRISFDSSALSDALVAAGKQELANRLGAKLDGLSDKLGIDVPELEGIKQGVLPESKGLLKGLFGGKQDDGR